DPLGDRRIQRSGLRSTLPNARGASGERDDHAEQQRQPAPSRDRLHAPNLYTEGRPTSAATAAAGRRSAANRQWHRPASRHRAGPAPTLQGRRPRVFMDAETRYAKNGDVHIAYRVFGDGPRDLVLVPGTVSHVELFWELPANTYLLRRLTSFARVIVFDKRGQ